MYEIFDIDGTLTKPGKDLWLLTTRSLVEDKVLFDREVSIWKEKISKGNCVYKESRKMMKKGLELFHKNIDGEKVKVQAKEIVVGIIQEKHYFPEAFEYIRRKTKRGILPIFSTTNYEEGGIGFVDALIQFGLLERHAKGWPVVSGTKINWKNRKIVHFNMGEGKIKGIAEKLGIGIIALQEKVKSTFGDDPMGNDCGIFRIAKKGYVIKNPKNSKLKLKPGQEHVNWVELLKRPN